MSELERLLAAQSGVVSRRQLLDLGRTDNDLRRLVRRRELSVLHPGVYVDHTGPPTWRQRAWGAVLFAQPAALGGMSALLAAGVRLEGPTEARIEVVVAHDRVVRAPAGVVVRRSDRTWERALLHTSPPRARVEDATLDACARAARDLDAIALLAAVVAQRTSTAGRLLEELESRPRLPRSSLLRQVLGDVASGTHSALEHAYLTRVERPHGLPDSRRQVRATSERARYEDVRYEALGFVVELDGLAFHGSPGRRDADLDRDLDRAVEGRDGVRLGWGQVVDRPCRTAERIGRLLQAHGWTGAVRRGSCCEGSG